MRLTSLLLQPVIPNTAAAILDRLGVAQNERDGTFIEFGRKGEQPLGNIANFKPFHIPELKSVT